VAGPRSGAEGVGRIACRGRLVQAAFFHFVVEDLARRIGQVGGIGSQIEQFTVVHGAIKPGEPLPLDERVVLHGQKYTRVRSHIERKKPLGSISSSAPIRNAYTFSGKELLQEGP